MPFWPPAGLRDGRKQRLGRREGRRAVTTGCSENGGGTSPIDDFAASLPPGKRLIGIDVGSKTLGLALSDVTRKIASPLVTVRRSRLTEDLRQLLDLAARHDAGGLV